MRDLPPVIELRPYQKAWIDDESRFLLGVKSARTGYSFASCIIVALDMLDPRKSRSEWSVLSGNGLEQAKQNIRTIKSIIELFHGIAEIEEMELEREIREATEESTTLRLVVPATGAVARALPMHASSIRGYPGNVFLDEFAHTEKSNEIFAAVGRQLALGHRIVMPSTPRGTSGAFYEIAKDLGLTDGVAPAQNPVKRDNWSGHWLDVHMAVEQGCAIDIKAMRQLFKTDPDMFRQEFECAFLEGLDAYIPLELVMKWESEAATVDLPPGLNLRGGNFYMGIDYGQQDPTIIWIKEKVGDVFWTRAVIELRNMPAPQQEKIILPLARQMRRVAMDRTGEGSGLFEYLAAKVGEYAMMGLRYGGNDENGVKIKTRLMVGLKRSLEAGKERLPVDPRIRQELTAIRREQAGNAVTFDAPRIIIESPSGEKKKKASHADRAWACAMATYAGDFGSGTSTDVKLGASESTTRQAGGYAA